MTEQVYKLYGLEMNPFSTGGSFPLGHENEKKIALAFAGRDEAQRIIKQSLVKLSKGMGFPVIAICGAYGYGKTHALKYIYWTTRESYADIIPIYIKGLQKPSGKELYTRIITTLIEVWTDTWLRKIFNNALSKINKFPEIKEQFNNIFPDMLRIARLVIQKKTSAMKWLLGYDLTFEELAKMSVFKNIDEENASKALSALSYLLYLGSEKKILYLIDELDKVINDFPKTELAKFYDFLRDVIDHAHGYYSLVLALPMMAVSGERSIPTLHPALHSRIQSGGFYILLKELTEKSAIAIVAKYLKMFRRADSKDLLDQLYPFSKSSIKKAVELTDGYPRGFIALLNKAIEMGITNGWTEITPERIEKVYNEIKEARPNVITEKNKSPLDKLIEEQQINMEDLLKKRLVDDHKEKLRKLLLGTLDHCMAWSKTKASLRISDRDLSILVEALEDMVEVIKVGKGKRICLKG